ncbi:hypothetical protein Slin14017_G128800 [Septoria linicola]|nr:hypothetical protein Slin14017_G128800 [Septoria linicola]
MATRLASPTIKHLEPRSEPAAYSLSNARSGHTSSFARRSDPSLVKSRDADDLGATDPGQQTLNVISTLKIEQGVKNIQEKLELALDTAPSCLNIKVHDRPCQLQFHCDYERDGYDSSDDEEAADQKVETFKLAELINVAGTSEEIVLHFAKLVMRAPDERLKVREGYGKWPDMAWNLTTKKFCLIGQLCLDDENGEGSLTTSRPDIDATARKCSSNYEECEKIAP